MRSRISRLQSDGSLERYDRFRKFLLRNQRPSPAHKSVGKTGIDLGSMGEMRNRFIPLLTLPRHLAQNIFRARILRIDLQFLLHLFFRFLRVGLRRIRLRKQQPPQPEMNPRHLRILLQNQAVLFRRSVPLPLRLQRFGVKFVAGS